MSVSVQARGLRWQLRVKHKLLPRPYFDTFDIEAEARAYGDQLRALLDRGIVPAELLAGPAKGAADPLLIEVVRGYTKGAPITDSDDALLGHMLPELVGVRMSGLTYLWADEYVRRLKLQANLAPSTIRKRVGVLARVVDWHLRRSTPPDSQAPANAFKLLPRGYSAYSRTEAAKLKPGQAAKRDVKRDRRLQGDEEARILAALAGRKHPDRERGLEPDPELELLFRLIVGTGLRLREAYRLRVDQVDMPRRVLHVDGSKGARGAIKPRTVPLLPELAERLRANNLGRIGLVFSFWRGTPDDLKKCTARLSARFATLFAQADVPELTEHDLRHEATCRWVSMRLPSGGWMYSDTEVCRVMGWTSADMMLRYASLRGEDLSARLEILVKVNS